MISARQVRVAVIVAAILSASLAGAVERERVAVLDFSGASSGLSEVAIQHFAELAREVALRRLGSKYNIITKENLISLLKAHGSDLKDCEGECETETGRLIGAHIVVSGHIYQVMGEYKINLKVHRTQPPLLLNAMVRTARVKGEIESVVKETARTLLGVLVADRGAVHSGESEPAAGDWRGEKKVKVIILTNPPDATVFFGSEEAVSPYSAFFRPGKYKLEVVKPRYKRHVQTVDLTGAVDVKTIRVDLLLHIEPAPAGGVDSAGLFQKANATLKSGRLAEAIRLYKAAVARSPQHREAWYNLGIAYSRAKQFEKEIAAYKEAIRVSATLYTKAMFNLAIAYEDQGQESRALALYEKVSAAEPGSVDARINLGILYARLRRYDDAIRSYRAAITREPDSRDAHFNLGIAYGRKAAQVSNKAEKAAFLRKEIAAYSKAVRIDFRHHKAWYNLAIAHHKLGHHKDEIIAYERAIQAKSDYPQALFNLAAAHQEQGAARKALGVWRSYLKVAQADPGEDAFVKAARLQISKLEAKLGE